MTTSLAGKSLLYLDNVHRLLPIATVLTISTVPWLLNINYLGEKSDSIPVLTAFGVIVRALLSIPFYNWAQKCSSHRSVQLESFALLMLAPSLSISEVSLFNNFLSLSITVGIVSALMSKKFSLSIILLVINMFVNPRWMVCAPVVFYYILSYCIGPAVYWQFQTRTVMSLVKTIGAILLIFGALCVTVYKQSGWDLNTRRDPNIPFEFSPMDYVPTLILGIPAYICAFTGKPQVLLWALSNCAYLSKLSVDARFATPSESFSCALSIRSPSTSYKSLYPLFTLLASVRYGEDRNVYAMGMWTHNLAYFQQLPRLDKSDSLAASLVWLLLFNIFFTKPKSILPTGWLRTVAMCLNYLTPLCIYAFSTLEHSFQDIWTLEVGLFLGNCIIPIWQFWRMISQTAPPPSSETDSKKAAEVVA